MSLLASLVTAPAGAYLQWGLGTAVMVAAGELFVVAMLLGWN